MLQHAYRVPRTLCRVNRGPGRGLWRVRWRVSYDRRVALFLVYDSGYIVLQSVTVRGVHDTYCYWRSVWRSSVSSEAVCV